MDSRDSFEVVKDLLLAHPEPTQEQAREIAPALFDIYQRLMRVRSVSPTTDVGERLWRLMELVGIKNRSLKKGSPPPSLTSADHSSLRPRNGGRVSNYTPGPWRIGTNYGVVADHPVHGLPGSEEVDYYGGHLIAESVAPKNQPIIAAAPEMYAALEAVLSDSRTRLPFHITAMVAAALDKARGIPAPKPLSPQLGGPTDPGPTSAGQGPDHPVQPSLSPSLRPPLVEPSRPVERSDGSAPSTGKERR